MEYPTIIQGGMGVAISHWRLAKTVSQLGHLGVVSGTGLGRVTVSRLMDGDLDGHVRRALSHFPFQEAVERLLATYYVAGGKAPNAPYKNPPPYDFKPTRSLDELTVLSAFVEIFLAKEGHSGLVGINLLEKIQFPTMATLYGALLAGVDYVLMGAGIPFQIPAILDRLTRHEAVNYRIDVLGAAPDDDYRLHFDPLRLFPNAAEQLGVLKLPRFLPIISSFVLAQALLKRSEGVIDGFVIEGPLAGGHNAPPRGQLKLNEIGEPIYGEKDEVDLEKMKGLGLPFWLAGNYGKPEQLEYALAHGAAGIQVGTAFAFCEESGMNPELRKAVLRQLLTGGVQVFTDPVASPTGFPFKVVVLEGTMADEKVYAARPRLCDLGALRSAYKRPDGKIGFRCPSEPVEDYVRKGGNAEDTENRVCLCNALVTTAGYPQHRKDGYVEMPIITSGNDLVNLAHFVDPATLSYTAKEVLDYLLRKEKEAAPILANAV